MARIVGGIGIAHSPSMGVEYDRAMRNDGVFSAEWQPWYDGILPVRGILADLAPDHLVVVYNDHLNYFTLDSYPTLALGIGDEFRQLDEGWGPRDLPHLTGDHEWGIHLATHLVNNHFDLTVCQELGIDHGIFSWFPYVLDPPWSMPVTPLAVNMIREPLPRPRRLAELGAALRTGIESSPRDERVLVVATGGMSHQISGTRFGIANVDFDRWFLERLPSHLDELLEMEVTEYARLGGTEAAELTLWFAMRNALAKDPEVRYSFHTFPKITGCGALVMAEPDAVTV